MDEARVEPAAATAVLSLSRRGPSGFSTDLRMFSSIPDMLARCFLNGEPTAASAVTLIEMAEAGTELEVAG